MNLAEDFYQADLVCRKIFCGQIFVGPELFENVVHLCERECGMKLMLALTVCVKTLGYLSDDLLLDFAGIGKRKRVEAHCLVVARPVFQRAASCKGPTHMDLAR